MKCQYRFKRLCENSNEAIIVQNGSKLIIRFHSDSTDNGKGFKAQIMLDQCKDKL